MNNTTIRKSRPEDWPALESLYNGAFPDEDLRPLVQDLLEDTQATVLSLVVTVGAERAVAGHVIFTPCGIVGKDLNVALLAPLAIAPKWQRQGLGTALVRQGLQMLRNDGVIRACVLGDPAYYGRFGFLPETGIRPPYSLPQEWRDAWQSIGLGTVEAQVRVQGDLSLPQLWLRPELWAPP